MIYFITPEETEVSGTQQESLVLSVGKGKVKETSLCLTKHHAMKM
jgi:hypothetical protein